MLNLQLSKKAQKFLSSLPPKQQKQLAIKIMEIRQKGHGADSTLLKGSLWHRVDFGEYRIIYTIEKKKVLVVPLVGKRNDDDVYKKLRRL